MNKDQKNVFKMLNTVSSFLNKNINIIESSVPIMTSKVIFDQKFAALNDNYLVQYQNNSGYALDKSSKRKAVEEKANAISIALCAYAGVMGNASLKRDCKFTETTLKTVSAYKLIGIGSFLILNVEQHLANLQPYGIDPNMLPDFKNTIDIFADSINKPNESIKIKRGATVALAKQFKDIRSFLKEHLDCIIKILNTTNPSFVRLYFSARHIGKTGYRALDLVVKTLDAGSQQPIEKAKLTIVGTKISRFSSQKGKNTFRHLKAGQYELLVSHPDYESKTIDCIIVDKETTTIVADLDKK